MQRTARRRRHSVPRPIEIQGADSQGYDARQPCCATIVRYTDREPARNEYPWRIVSPSRPGPCCVNQMQPIGKVQEEGLGLFQYKRCPKCGFAVRHFLAQRPDAVLAAELRLLLARSFVRNVGAELWVA
jgi:hypothetical protein